MDDYKHINTKAIKDILQGRVPSKKTSVSFSNAGVKEHKIRQIGDVWIEENPITGVKYRCEQREGYQTKVPENLTDIRSNIRSFDYRNCNKESNTCNSNNPNRLDVKFNKMNGMCSDCHFKHETQLKVNGIYREYSRKKILRNIASFLIEAEHDKETIKKSIDYEFVNDAGYTEKWTSNINKDEYFKYIDDEFEKFKLNLLESYGYSTKDLDSIVDGSMSIMVG